MSAGFDTGFTTSTSLPGDSLRAVPVPTNANVAASRAMPATVNEASLGNLITAPLTCRGWAGKLGRREPPPAKRRNGARASELAHRPGLTDGHPRVVRRG